MPRYKPQERHSLLLPVELSAQHREAGQQRVDAVSGARGAKEGHQRSNHGHNGDVKRPMTSAEATMTILTLPGALKRRLVGENGVFGQLR
tara:strand:- start:117 stop:386 length:270 start_codon:yes stop_codon:yes gene_type:complete